VADADDEGGVTDEGFRFTTSLRHLQDGVLLRTHGIGTYRTTISSKGISVEPRLLGGPSFDIPLQSIERIENTGRGIRIRFDGEGSPILIGTFRRRKLTEAILATCPQRYDPATRPSGFGRI